MLAAARVTCVAVAAQLCGLNENAELNEARWEKTPSRRRDIPHSAHESDNLAFALAETRVVEACGRARHETGTD